VLAPESAPGLALGLVLALARKLGQESVPEPAMELAPKSELKSAPELPPFLRLGFEPAQQSLKVYA